MLITRLIALLLLAVTAAAPAAAQTFSGPARVIDGDTIVVDSAKIRLHGIDAPEQDQQCTRNGASWPCGAEATAFLQAAISDDLVICRVTDVDRYSRFVANCSARLVDLNAFLVRQGYALAYRRYSLDYAADEADAEAAGRGLWSGKFVPPWDWRRGVRLPTHDIRPDGCAIKGNINAKGRRIYHVPGSASYGPTIIDEIKGERWFCSENEARAAGWVKP